MLLLIVVVVVVVFQVDRERNYRPFVNTNHFEDSYEFCYISVRTHDTVLLLSFEDYPVPVLVGFS